jgi:hypothetical protein
MIYIQNSLFFREPDNYIPEYVLYTIIGICFENFL